VTRRVFWIPAAGLALNSCGYHVSGKADLLPKTIHTIAIPAFYNNTRRQRLPEKLTTAVTREFITRSRYRIVPDANAADALLQGSVVNYVSYPTVSDPDTGRATGVQFSVFLSITLTERLSGKVLFARPNMEVRERYEISVDERAYFEESDAAIERLSRDVARSLVSAILSGF